MGTAQPRRVSELARRVIILPYSEDVARTWGADLRGRDPARTAQASQRHLDRRVHPDLWPALATLNTKDFRDFAEHDGLNLIIQAT